MEQEPPYKIARTFSPGDQTPALPCLACRALRRFEVLTAWWEKQISTLGYSRVEREGEVIVTGKPPSDGMAIYYESWFIDGRCATCGATTKLKRLFCDEEGWHEWFVPSGKDGYDGENRNYWNLIEDYDNNDNYYYYLLDPSHFFIEIVEENRWLKILADELDEKSNQ